MKKTKSILSLFITAIMVAVSLQTSAQAKPFTTISGLTDTMTVGAATNNMYCINYNPAQEAIVQIEVTASSHSHDSLYGVAAVWGSVDNVSFIQLAQLDTYNANFSDSLVIATGTHGVSLRKSKMWTYDLHRTSQPIPRYFKVVYTNKQVAVTDTTDLKATLFVNP